MTGRPGARLARALSARGVFTDPEWHRAVLAVSRAAFVPDTVWVSSRDHPGWYRPVARDDPEYAAWVDEDWALMTQLDDGHPVGQDGWGRLPTSSISQPSLVLAMLHALDVRDGHHVLEIGTGTGYNTALLCARLGSENVTSIEVDPDVAARAAVNLADAGYKPRLIVGDAAREVDGAPFDRVLATVAAHRFPPSWIRQARPGGLVVSPWSTWFSPGVLVRLAVGADATASGRVVGEAPFMMLRHQRAADVLTDWRDLVHEEDPAARSGRTDVNPFWIADRDDGWSLAVGHLVPGVDFVTFTAKDDSGEASVYVFDRGTGSGSWALGEYAPHEASWETKSAGPRNLWAEIGAARTVWEAAGRPGRDRLGLTVTPDGEHLLWVDEPGRVLTLPGG